MKSKILKLAPAAMMVAFALPQAMAHHGWAWAEDKQTEITGTILAINIAPPHPRIDIETDDGVEWRVDLGNPRRTDNANFVEGAASVGQRVVARGHRSLDSDEQLFKAVRITVEGEEFTFYPERIE